MFIHFRSFHDIALESPFSRPSDQIGAKLEKSIETDHIIIKHLYIYESGHIILSNHPIINHTEFQAIPAQSLATVFIIIFVFPSPRPLPCINKKFMNSDGHQMAWTVRSARVYRIQRSKSIKLNTDSRVVAWQLEEKYISYHSPTIKNDITRSDACKRRRNSVKSSDVGRQKVPCTS